MIHFAEKIGATNDILLQTICVYLRKHKQTLLDTLDQRKNNLHAVIESLAFHCTTDHEKHTVLQLLRTFARLKTESFASCFTRFESLHIFFLQLDQPSTADQIRLVSYKTVSTVTPYFISNKCAQAYGKYVVEQVKMGEVITKENIIKTITTLEQYVDLRLTVTKTLPASLIDTTLNLPPGETEIHLQAPFHLQ